MNSFVPKEPPKVLPEYTPEMLAKIEAEEKAWQEEVDRLIEHGYITTKNEPLKCTACESANLEDVNTDYWAGYIMSFDRKCKDCGVTLNYWDTGSWHY